MRFFGSFQPGFVVKPGQEMKLRAAVKWETLITEILMITHLPLVERCKRWRRSGQEKEAFLNRQLAKESTRLSERKESTHVHMRLFLVSMLRFLTRKLLAGVCGEPCVRGDRIHPHRGASEIH